MKIIEPGRVPESAYLYRGRCDRCGCLVECRREEVTVRAFNTTVGCPTEDCGREIDLMYLQERDRRDER